MGRCPTRNSGGFRSGPKKGLQTALESEVLQEIEALLGRGAVAELDFEALEMALRHGTLRLAAWAIEQRLNADTSDELDSPIPCGCGGEAKFAGRRSKQFQSVLGPLRLERAYYHCSSCGQGGCPRDRYLGMENTSLSPALTRMTGTVGAMVSFQEGSELLQELAGVVVDAKQVERTAEALGEEIAADERQHSEPLDRLPLPKTLYLGIDGTGIPLRAQELRGVPGKRDGAAKTREVKLCTVWSAESFDRDGNPVRDRDRSAIRQPSKVLSFRTSPNNVLPLLNVSGAKPSGAVSPRPRVPRHSEMVPPGSGIWSRNYFLAPSRSLTAFMPSSTSVSSAKLSMVPSLRAPPSGPNEDMKNSIAESSVHCSPPFAGRWRTQKRRAAV